MSPRSLGLAVAVLGAGVVVVGLLIASGALSWFGRLPGDIRIEGRGTRVYVPITSMIVVSIVVSLVLALISRR
ncbi:MAG: DUF2905 domain-containing protein [Actinobacteria bacterium]|nr:DUF2905 domain-containing protein [Actinomycetota bacterium]